MNLQSTPSHDRQSMKWEALYCEITRVFNILLSPIGKSTPWGIETLLLSVHITGKKAKPIYKHPLKTEGKTENMPVSES